MPLINVGSVAVDIVPSAKGFQQKLDAAVRNAQVQVKAVLDDSGIRQQLAQVTRDATVSVRVNLDDKAATLSLDAYEKKYGKVNVHVDVDDKAATAELDAVTRDRSATVDVDADTGAASAKLDEISRPRSATLNVNADTGLAAAKIATIGVGIAGIGGALTAIVPAAAAAGAAVAGIGASALAAAGGLGVLVLGFKGVFSAVSATQKAQAGAAAAAAQNAAAQQAAAARVVAAQQSLQSAQDGLRSSQDGLKSAQAGLANAQAVAADAAVKAAEAIKNAQTGVRQATQQAAAAVTSALGQEATAERTLQTALQQETAAQQALSAARKQARQDLQDLNDSVADGALAQRQATIDVENARAALQQLGPTQAQIEQAVARTAAAQNKYALLLANPKATQVQKDSAKAAMDAAAAQQKLLQQSVGGTEIQRQQAQLDYDQAIQHQKELATQQQRLTQQQKASQKAGIEGSAPVRSARQNLGAAKQGVSDAQANLAQAQQAVTQARLDGVAKIQKAEQTLADAERAQTSQQRQSEYSIAQAQQQVVSANRQIESSQRRVIDAQKSLQTAYSKTGPAASTAATQAASAMSKLTPQGRALATMITSKIIPGFEQLSNVAQKPLALGALKGLQAAKPLMPVITNLVKVLSDAMGGLISSAGKALGSPFWINFFKMIAKYGPDAIKTFGGIAGNVGKGFAGLITAFAPVGKQIGSALLDMSKGFANFGTGKTGALQDFLGYVEKIGPKVVGTFGSLWTLAGNLLKALAPVGGVALDVIKKVADAFNKMPAKSFGDMFQKILTPAIKLFGDVATKVIIPLLPLVGPIVGAIAKAFESIIGLITSNMPLITTIFGLVAKTVGQIGKLLATPAFKAIVTELLGMLTGALKIITGVLDLIIGVFTGNTKLVKKGVQEIFAGIKQIVLAWVTYMMSEGKIFAKNIFKLLVGPVTSAKDSLSKLFGPGGPIRTAFTNVKNWVTGVWSKAWSGAKAAVMTPINAARDALSALFGPSGPVRSTFTNVKNWVTSTWAKVWSAAKSTVMTPINAARDALAALFGQGGPIRSAFSNVKAWVTGTWSAVWKAVKGVITSPISAAKSAIETLLGASKGGLQSIFSNAVDKIGSIWNGLEALAKKPINFIVNTVLNNGLLKAFNSVASFFGGGPIKPIPWPPKGWARGGVLPGFTPVAQGDDILAPMRSGEGVAVSEAMRDPVERARLIALNNHVLRGGNPASFRDRWGYARGGIVKPINARITQGIHDQYTGFPAVDAAAPVGTPVVAGAAGRVVKSYDIRGYEPRKVGPQDGYRSYGRVIQIASQGFQTLYAHLSQRLAQVGQMVQAGQEIGLSGNTGNTTGPHLHFGAQGISPLDFWQGKFGKIIGAVTGALSSINPANVIKTALTKGIDGLSTVANSPFGGMLMSATGWLKDKVLGWAKDKIAGVVGLGSGAQRWAPTVRQALGIAGLPQTDAMVSAWVRQINTESSGDPNRRQQVVDVNSGRNAAVGLVQVALDTFNAYRDKSLPNDRTNPLSDLVAGMNWEKHKKNGDVAAILADIGHGHGYDSGGWLQPGTTIVHNGTGKPEPVFTNPQWATLNRLAAGGSGGGLTVNQYGVAPDSFVRDIVGGIEKSKRRSAVKHGLGRP